MLRGGDEEENKWTVYLALLARSKILFDSQSFL